MEKLTRAEIAEYKEVFSMFDMDGDGTVDANELGTVMATLGVNPTAAEIAEMIEQVDTDKNGTIDFAEFCNLMVSKTKGTEDPIQEAKMIFGMIDKDGDGFINRTDLETVVATVSWGMTDRPPREQDVTDMLSIKGANGKVSFEQFLDIMQLSTKGTS